MTGIYHCPDCQKIFRKYNNLQQHQITRHPDAPSSQPSYDSLNITLDLTDPSFACVRDQLEAADMPEPKAKGSGVDIERRRDESAYQCCSDEISQPLDLRMRLPEIPPMDCSDLLKIIGSFKCSGEVE